MSLEINKATPVDAEELQTTWQEGLDFKLSKGDEAWSTDSFTLDEANKIIKRGDTYMVTLDGQLAGSLVLRWDDERTWGQAGLDGQAGYVHRLITRDAFRGQDLGGKIINWTGDQVREIGRSYLRLDCRLDNKKLCEYYEAHDFRQVGVNKLKDDAALYERPV